VPSSEMSVPLLPVQTQLVDERRHSFGLVELCQRVRGVGHVDASRDEHVMDGQELDRLLDQRLAIV
jgi:hypothetical protein